MNFKPVVDRPGKWRVVNGEGVHVAGIEVNDAGAWSCQCYEGADFTAAQLRKIAEFLETLK